jgi:hypothetical protein
MNRTTPPGSRTVLPTVAGSSRRIAGGNTSPETKPGGDSASCILTGDSTDTSPEVKEEMYFENAGSGSISFCFIPHPDKTRKLMTVRKSLPFGEAALSKPEEQILQKIFIVSNIIYELKRFKIVIINRRKN